MNSGTTLGEPRTDNANASSLDLIRQSSLKLAPVLNMSELTDVLNVVNHSIDGKSSNAEGVVNPLPSLSLFNNSKTSKNRKKKQKKKEKKDKKDKNKEDEEQLRSKSISKTALRNLTLRNSIVQKTPIEIYKQNKSNHSNEDMNTNSDSDSDSDTENKNIPQPPTDNVKSTSRSKDVSASISRSKSSSESVEISYADREEGRENYKKGGYHPVKIGDVFNNRYTVISKLGWGHFSTVWLCEDSQTKTRVAIKIIRSAQKYTDAALDEITILNEVNKSDPDDTKNCLRFIDSFKHSGPNGDHMCLVFEALGNNLYEVIKRNRYTGLPIPIVKTICRQILIGLDFLHTKCQLIHTDLKPENILLNTQFTTPLKVSKSTDKKQRHNSSDRSSSSSSSSSSCSTSSSSSDRSSDSRKDQRLHKHKSRSKGNKHNKKGKDKHKRKQKEKRRREREREKAKKHAKKDGPVDLSVPENWKVKIGDLGNACWTYKHITEDIHTREYRSPEVIVKAPWNESSDIWSFGCMVFELLTGDLLFEPCENKDMGFNKSDDHLAQMIELIGGFPKYITQSGKKSRDFFNRRGEMKYIRKFNFWKLADVLVEKYHWNENDAKDVAEFILPMLTPNPNRRPGAKAMLEHSWLKE